MKKSTIVLSVIAATLAVAANVVLNLYFDACDEINRLQSNQNILLHNGNTHIGTTDEGHSVASTGELTLKLSEFQQSNDSLRQALNEMKIKERRVKRLTTTTSQSQVEVIAPVRDSAIVSPGHVDTVSCLHYSDPWLSMDGCIADSQFTGTIESRDTLIHVAHRIPRRFLFFRFGTKAVEIEVMSKNPHTKITHIKHLEFE